MNDAAALRRENGALHARVASLEAEKRALEEAQREALQRVVALERQSAHVSSLYVATYQLLGGIDREHVLNAMQEIVVNLIGSEELAIFELDSGNESLRLSASYGLASEGLLQRVPVGRGTIGKVATTGVACFAEEEEACGDPSVAAERGLTACVPLKVHERVVGVLAVFGLLPQKTGFSAVDHELFDLLGMQAAMALHSASLHSGAGHAQTRA